MIHTTVGFGFTCRNFTLHRNKYIKHVVYDFFYSGLNFSIKFVIGNPILGRTMMCTTKTRTVQLFVKFSWSADCRLLRLRTFNLTRFPQIAKWYLLFRVVINCSFCDLYGFRISKALFYSLN